MHFEILSSFAGRLQSTVVYHVGDPTQKQASNHAHQAGISPELKFSLSKKSLGVQYCGKFSLRRFLVSLKSLRGCQLSHIGPSSYGSTDGFFLHFENVVVSCAHGQVNLGESLCCRGSPLNTALFLGATYTSL